MLKNHKFRVDGYIKATLGYYQPETRLREVMRGQDERVV